MKLSATIHISGDAKDLKKLFLTENQSIKNDRASFAFKTKEDDFIITITALDSTAFRAALNSAAKLISIYEKTNEVVNDGN